MLRQARPTSPGRRNRIDLVMPELSKDGPTKALLNKGVFKRQGRNNAGKVTVRHRGGGVKRKLRMIEWKRQKYDIPGTIKTIEYDPMRSSHVALVVYADGEKSYILCPNGLQVGDQIVSGQEAEIKVGNAMPLSRIPVGMAIHNIELRPGKGAQLVRGAGTLALIQSKEGKFVTVQMPSKELRLIKAECFATIGQVGNLDWKNIQLGKAGRKRLMGWRPEVRGTAQHPGSHPHGGGEGRSGVGLKHPKTPWGKPALGKKTRRNKWSNKFIVRDRRVK